MESESLTDSLREVVDLLEGSGRPWTTSEVADQLDIGRRSTYERLERLAEQDLVETKKVGASARVWWHSGFSGGTASGPGVGSREDRSDHVLFERLVGTVEEYAIFTLDPDGYVQTWNPGARQIKGYAEEDIVGKHFSTFYTEEDVEADVPGENLAAAARRGAIEDEGWRVRADGSRFWANVTISAIRDDAGDLEGFAKVTRDMTERREREQSVREERAFVESILDNQRDVVYAYDTEGQFIRWNERFNEVTGYTDDEIGAMEPEEFVADEAVERTERGIEQVLSEEESVTIELPLETADGEEIPYEFTASPMRDENDETIGLTGVGRDVSDRKARERLLRRQRDEVANELTQVFDRVDDAFFGLDEEWRFTYVNDRAHAELDVEDRELTGTCIWDVFPEAVDTPFQEHYERAVETQETVSFEEYFESLDTWFEVTAYPSESGLSVYFRDVSDRKERERELVRYETMFEESKDVNVVLTPDGTIEYVTPSVESMFGYDPEKLEGEFGFDYVHPDDREHTIAEFERMIESPSYESEVEFRFEHADGSWRVLEALGRNLVDDPDIGGIVVYTRDVTGREERERELELYETIVSNIDDGVYVLDEEGRFQMVNDAYVEMTGYDPDDLVGSPASLVVDEDVAASADATLEDILAGTADNGTLEADIHRADGTTLRAESNFTALTGRNWDAPRKVGVVRDTSERYERERALEESRRRYQTLVENFPNGAVALVDEDLRYVTVGGSPIDDPDATPEALEGHRIEDVLSDELAEILVSKYEAAFDGETSRFQRETSQGVFQFHVLPVRDADGEVFAAMGMSQDVTERTEFERQLRDRVRQQQVVTELGSRALSDLDLDALMAEAADLVADTLGNDYCKVLDLDRGAEELLLRQGVGWDDGIVGSATVSAVEDDSQAAYTLANEAPVNVEDLETETRFSGPDLLTDHDVRSGISVVIGPHDDPWGILGTHDTDRREFSEQDVNFVQSVANILSNSIERHDHESAILHQREQLAALNSLNYVVNEITEAVIDRSTRDEIERVVCEYLADSDSYLSAWIGEVDVPSQIVDVRARAGTDGYLDGITITTDPEDARSQGPTGRAFRTGEIQTTHDVHADDRYEPWRDHAEGYDFCSSAAIPIRHGDTVYGVLNVYADRPAAFEGQEREVLAQLGEVVGHAIAATERKQALMSDEVVELEFYISNVFEAIGVSADPVGTIALEHAVPLDDGKFVVYGTATDDAVENVERLTEAVPHWDAVTFREVGDETHFELEVSEPPVLSAVAAQAGSVDRAVIEGGDYYLQIHLAPSADVRRMIDVVQDAYPEAEMLKRRQIERERDTGERVHDVLTDDLTGRQRAAIEAAYHAGFFEWPRETSGEEVADALDVSAPTFHQHLRKAEKKMFDAILSGSTAT